ncbi:MAG: TetR family transcriptional regulator [Lysobacterales bacterium]|jgi:AcrR family transcriptional regulator
MENTGAKTEQRRTRGRPPTEDEPRIREAILDSAEGLFAAKGYAAVSLREIAGRSGATPAMIHYYFDNKHTLLRMVFERALEPMAQAVARMKTAPSTPVSDIIGLLMTTLRSHPAMSVLMMREVMLPGGALQAYFLEAMAPRLGGALPGILDTERSRGGLSRELDPAVATVFLLALSFFPFVARDLAEQGLGISYDTEGLDSLARHALRIAERGFSP